MKPKHQRLLFIVFGLGMLSGAAMLTLNNFRDNIVFYYTPSELKHKQPGQDAGFRLGGLVKPGSIAKGTDERIEFTVTDGKEETIVTYQGALPSLFREGQGVVAEGTLGADGTVTAKRILAKHDENYMPPEVARMLKEQGHWQANGQPPTTGNRQPTP